MFRTGLTRETENKLYNVRPFTYDGVILGSSRTTFINENDFTGLNAFNYAVSSTDPREYDAYIEYAKEQKGSGTRVYCTWFRFPWNEQK